MSISEVRQDAVFFAKTVIWASYPKITS